MEHHIEKKLQEKFKSYSPIYDASSMWADLDKELDKDDKGKQRFLWFILPGLTIIITAFFLLPINNQQQTVADTIITESSVTNFAQQDEAPATLATESVLRPKSSESQAQPNGATMQSAMQQTSNLQASTLEYVPVKASSVRQPVTKVNKRITYGAQAITERTIESKTAETMMTKSKQIGVPLNSQTDNLLNLELMPHLSLSALVVEPYLPQISLSPISQLVKQSHDFNRWLVNINVAGGLLQSQLSSRAAGAGSLVNLREQIEFDNESYGASVGITYNLTTHWSVNLGLGYQLYYTSGELASVESELITKTDTIAIINGVNGEQVINGPREFLSTTRMTHLRYNKHQQAYLSVCVAYANSFNEKWGYRLGMGYAPSLWTDISGYEQDHNDLVYSITIDSEERLKARGSNRLLFYSRLTRQLEKGSQIYLGLSAMPDVSGIYKSTNNIQKKSHLLQLNASLAIPLNFKK